MRAKKRKPADAGHRLARHPLQNVVDHVEILSLTAHQRRQRGQAQARLQRLPAAQPGRQVEDILAVEGAGIRQFELRPTAKDVGHTGVPTFHRHPVQADMHPGRLALLTGDAIQQGVNEPH